LGFFLLRFYILPYTLSTYLRSLTLEARKYYLFIARMAVKLFELKKLSASEYPLGGMAMAQAGNISFTVGF
jgi:hypothetical protein